MAEILIAALIILIALSAFFSGTETALMSLNMAKVRALQRQKKRGAEALYRIKQKPHKILITILLGNNLMNIGAAALATVAFTEIFGSTGVGIATGVMTFLVLVFGEITPKTFATQNAERMSLIVARPIEILSIILYPFVWFFEKISHGMARLLGSKKEKALSEEELKAVVTMGVEEGILDKEAAEMMHNVLEFRDTKVTEIMTRKVDMLIVDGEKKLRDVLTFVIKTPYSRYPVYLKNEDNIIGILFIDDILPKLRKGNTKAKVKSMVRKVYFVPESKEIDDLLVEFEGKHTPMAIVVDEYGDVSGLVTVEDILEEIVGDIFDKSNRTSVYIKKINDRVVRANAKASIQEINRVLHLGIEAEKFDTIAGFIEHKLKRIPKKGEEVKLKNVIITVDQVTKRGIKSVRIEKK